MKKIEKILKPCPFCGSKFKISTEAHDNHPVGGMAYIYHDYGKLDSPARKCILDIHQHFNSENEAAEAWNKRANIFERSSLYAVLEERERQVSKGYDAEHDDSHIGAQLIKAPWGALSRISAAFGNGGDVEGYKKYLTQAAAQIVAELDRVNRAALSKHPEEKNEPTQDDREEYFVRYGLREEDLP